MGGFRRRRLLLGLPVALVLCADVAAAAATVTAPRSNSVVAATSEVTATASPVPSLPPLLPSPSPTGSPSPPSPPPVHYAWVRPAVVNVWERRDLVRRVDRPSMAVPPRMRAWVHAMSLAQRRDLDGRLMTQALHGQKVVVLATTRGWSLVRVLAQTGSHFRTGIVGWVVNGQLSSTLVPGPYQRQAPTVRDEIANARRLLGVAYLWAGMSSYGIDCSGLTYLAFRPMGITLPRDAADQSRVGYAVARRHLRPGDLVFFGSGGWQNIHHVGIYLGRGLVLHAPHTGTTVQITPLSVWSDYWGARRVIR